MSILKKIFGDPNLKEIKKVGPIVDEINILEKDLLGLNLDALKAKTTEFKERLAKGETLDDILPETFAVVREASKRVNGQRHFDVQLIGGIFLHNGYITEMRTGEGKTLTATAAVYLNALEDKGVHVITVNDYLAKRDAVWMGRIYNTLGLTVGCIQQQMQSFVYEPGYQEESKARNQNLEVKNHEFGIEEEKEAEKEKKNKEKEIVVGSLVKIEPSHLHPCSRREAYQCDILYGTNNEFGFDYLRDNMATNLSEMVQRDLHYAIVDEVDSILIDEARTPLIISAPAEEAAEKYYKFAELVGRLKENDDYNIDEKMRSSTLTDEGINKIEEWLGVGNIYADGGVGTVHHLEQALKASALFKRDRDYVVKDGEIIIVDEFTGRMMFGRRYSEGLHQAIEAKEKVAIQRESQTLATITFQNYFRLYKKLAGMTGTAATEAEEFSKIYNLEVIEIPTNKEMIRRDLSDRIYKNEHGKFMAVAHEVKERHGNGQPVLIGTISIEKNELLSGMLEMEGIPHQILNAKNHEREAETISQAGKPGAVTLATNMAGRGVDIILGGNIESKKAEILGQDISEESKKEELQVLENRWIADRDKVLVAGGLHVLGTERHESRRIDNQLRGRSGRQGDQGSSQFYVSMEDDLMRIFGSDKIKRMMEFLKMPEDLPIENKMVSKSLETAQRKVEENNFDIRKHLLDYDDVLNKHRTVIYKKRREILDEYEAARAKMKVASLDSANSAGDKVGAVGVEVCAISGSKAVGGDFGELGDKILEMVEKEIEQFVYYHTAGTEEYDWNLKEIYETAITIFLIDAAEKEELFKFGGEKADGRLEEAAGRTKIIEFLFTLAKKHYIELKEKINNQELMLEIEKGLLLRSIDTLWVEHLVEIDYLRTGIGLRGYGQRDPLVEYKKEAYRMFNELMILIQKEVVYSIFKVGIGLEMAPSLMARHGIQMSGAAKEAMSAAGGLAGGTGGAGGGTGAGGGSAFFGSSSQKEFSHDFAGRKIGRNDQCPCGSGKKYKKCHGV